MKAVIISNLEGNRLRPITCSTAKSMLPVLGKPVSEYTIKLLRRHGICDITLITGHLSEEIKKYFQSNPVRDVTVKFAQKEALENITSDDDVLLISGSVLTDLDIDAFSAFHKKMGGDASCVTQMHSEMPEHGIVDIARNYKITAFTKFADNERNMPANCIMGIMLLSKGTPLECGNVWSCIQKLADEKKEIYAYPSKDYICDISSSESYFKAVRDFLDKKINLPFPFDEKESGVWISDSASISKGVILSPPVFIGDGSIINRGTRIEPYSVIGSDCKIGRGTSIKRSIIMDNVRIESGCSLRGTIICNGAEIGEESAAYEGSILADNAVMGRHCTLRPSVKIWPDKYIESETSISSNVVWNNSASHSVFSDGCAIGKINCEITPEFASLLGCAASRLLGKKIAVSSDRGGGSTMIRNALISGIQSQGATAYDFGEQPLPITRSGIRFYSLDGGLALSTYCKDDRCYASIDIINESGSNIEENLLSEIRTLLSSGDIPRASAYSIPDVEYLFEYKLYYLKQLINSTTKKALSAKLLLHCPESWAEELLKSAATDLDCNFTFTESSLETDFIDVLLRGDYDFGVSIDYKCELLTLVTRSGRIISEFDYSALTALITMKQYKSAVIYTPLSSPESIESLAAKYGATVHRTKLSPPNLMNELSKKEEKMFMSQFIFRFDAVGALIMLLDFLSSSKTSLEALLRELPVSYTVSTSVSCPASNQNTLMKRLFDRYGTPTGDNDNIKLTFDKGWVIVVPRRSQSSIHIISHSFSEEYARELADICTDNLVQ